MRKDPNLEILPSQFPLACIFGPALPPLPLPLKPWVSFLHRYSQEKRSTDLIKRANMYVGNVELAGGNFF